MVEPSGIRIGDAERDQAVAGLAEHFAAGRLNKAEYDERADEALQARFRSDLDPLFADLPGAAADNNNDNAAMMRPIAMVSGRQRPGWSPIMMLFPMLMVGVVVTAVVLHAPWMLFGVFWLFVFTGFGRRHHWHHDRAQQHQQWQQHQHQQQQQQQQEWQQRQLEWQRLWQNERQRRQEHHQHYR